MSILIGIYLVEWLLKVKVGLGNPLGTWVVFIHL